MQIGIVCHETFHGGGIQIQVRELSNRFAAAGHTVVLFAPPPAPGLATGLDSSVILQSIPTSDLPLTSMASFALQVPLAFRKVERRMGPFEIVHSHTYADTFLARSTTRGLRIVTVHHLGTSAAESMKLAVVSRVSHPAREYGPAVVLEGFCIARADHLVAVSQFTKNDILRKYPRVDAARISVIYPGSRAHAPITNPEVVQRLKRAWGLADSERLLLYVGRLEERKGISFLLKAFSLLDPHMRVKLSLVGEGDVSAYWKQALMLRIAEKVVFAGYVDDITLSTAYGLASALVHPAPMEGFGLTIADAVASGLPVVATRAGAIPELVRDGIDGFLSEYGDSRAFADSIEKALEMAIALGDKRESAESMRFTWERTANDTLSLYERLLSARGHHGIGKPGEEDSSR